MAIVMIIVSVGIIGFGLLRVGSWHADIEGYFSFGHKMVGIDSKAFCLMVGGIYGFEYHCADELVIAIDGK